MARRTSSWSASGSSTAPLRGGRLALRPHRVGAARLGLAIRSMTWLTGWTWAALSQQIRQSHGWQMVRALTTGAGAGAGS